uniref:Uncharacterized protein n=1 Tax=Myoviridae sp. ctk6V34 TaxID=2825164 RepID=A0A8S5V3L7_9CAUD|nr:MAG TPA: hypothetical protein [Myoviridae sp. ctk6V34]
MGNAIIMGSGKTPPPNSVEIEVTAAEDIKAGEFVTVGFNSSDEATIEQNPFEIAINPTPIFSNKEPDGLFWAKEGNNSYLLRISETGTVEIGTTIPLDDGDTGAITYLARYNDIFVGVTSKKYYLYSLDGLTLTKVTSLAPQKTVAGAVNTMYDINSRLISTAEKTSAGSSSIYYGLLKFTDTTLEILDISKTSYPGTVGSIKTDNGYKIAFAGHYSTLNAFVEFYVCDNNFENITYSKRVQLSVSNGYGLKEIFADDGYLYFVNAYKPSSNAPYVSLYKVKIDWESEIAEIESQIKISSSSTNTPNSNYIFFLGGVVGVFGYSSSSNYSYRFKVCLLPNMTFNEFELHKASTTFVSMGNPLFISNNKAIIQYSFSGVTNKTCYVVDLLKAYNSQITGNALAKTSALAGNAQKSYIKGSPSVTYYVG